MLIWFGIIFCLSQSALFSGLNIALFSVSRMRLEVAAAGDDAQATKVLAIRRNSNLALTTILWGNVAINVLLALLSESVMSGIAAFLFSTAVITFLGEIAPQAWFSRHAMRMAALASPVLRFYMLLLYPVAKPSSLILDRWLGREGIQYYRERDFREVIRRHMDADSPDIGHIEGVGALNFLAIDDLPVHDLGSEVAEPSIVSLPFDGDMPRFPRVAADKTDPFLYALHRGGEAWTILTDEAGTPRAVLDTDEYLREMIFGEGDANAEHYTYRPTVLEDENTLLGHAMAQMLAAALSPAAKHRYRRVLLVWSTERRIITSDDLLQELLRGVVPAG